MVSMGVGVGSPWGRRLSWCYLGLPLGAGVLLGAILALTDPVPATDVQIVITATATSSASP